MDRKIHDDDDDDALTDTPQEGKERDMVCENDHSRGKKQNEKKTEMKDNKIIPRLTFALSSLAGDAPRNDTLKVCLEKQHPIGERRKNDDGREKHKTKRKRK